MINAVALASNTQKQATLDQWAHRKGIFSNSLRLYAFGTYLREKAREEARHLVDLSQKHIDATN